ncbi:MAG: serpin family protein [Bacteroidetes bacterium]|nr:serpin family protein [Bacteroidota bacterium]
MRANPRAGFVSACLLLFLVLTLPSCHKDSPTPAISKPLDLPPNSGPVLEAGNDFAFKIFRSVLQYDPATTNKLISPLSIYTCLSMVYNGTAGATRDSMTKTLSLNGITPAQLNAVSKALIEQMPNEDSKVQLAIANSIWYNKSSNPIPTFLDTIRNNFQAVVQALDFTQPSSVNTINSWVTQHTNNKIPTIIDKLEIYDLMLLVNAVYFNGAWKNTFKTENTRNDIFYRTEGGTVNVPFMNQQMTIRAYHTQTYDLIELPYGTGKAFNMYLALPVRLPNGTPASLNSFAAAFDRTSITAALSHLDSTSLTISLPKWEYRYGIENMYDQLSAIGMNIAFTKDADLTRMYPPSVPAYISQVIHKTYIKVNEEGTEAAAVTAARITALVTAPAPPQIIKFDHPFAYFIAEKQTGSILFMGLLNDPSPSR